MSTTAVREGRVAVPGGEIWYTVVGSGGIPLVVVHGGPGLPHEYLTTLDALSDERPVVFYDHLGCGRSDRPGGVGLWTLDRSVKELQCLLETLGYENVHLLGHSYGSTVVAELLLRDAPTVRSVIFASPFLSTRCWLDDMAMYRRQLPSRIQQTLTEHEKTGAFDNEAFHRATRIFYQHVVCRMSPWPALLEAAGREQGLDVYYTLWGPTEFIINGNLRDYDCTDRLGEIDIPALFTCGRFDTAAPRTVQSFSEMIPDSRYVVFESSAHMPHLEETEAYVATVESFLRTL